MDYLHQSPRKSPRFGGERIIDDQSRIVTRSSPRHSEKSNSRVSGLRLRGSPRTTPQNSPRNSPKNSPRAIRKNISGDIVSKDKTPDKAIKNLKFIDSKLEEEVKDNSVELREFLDSKPELKADYSFDSKELFESDSVEDLKDNTLDLKELLDVKLDAEVTDYSLDSKVFLDSEPEEEVKDDPLDLNDFFHVKLDTEVKDDSVDKKEFIYSKPEAEVKAKLLDSKEFLYSNPEAEVKEDSLNSKEFLKLKPTDELKDSLLHLKEFIDLEPETATTDDSLNSKEFLDSKPAEELNYDSIDSKTILNFKSEVEPKDNSLDPEEFINSKPEVEGKYLDSEDSEDSEMEIVKGIDMIAEDTDAEDMEAEDMEAEDIGADDMDAEDMKVEDVKAEDMKADNDYQSRNVNSTSDNEDNEMPHEHRDTANISDESASEHNEDYTESSEHHRNKRELEIFRYNRPDSPISKDFEEQFDSVFESAGVHLENDLKTDSNENKEDTNENKDNKDTNIIKVKPKKKSWRARYWRRGQQPPSLLKRLKKKKSKYECSTDHGETVTTEASEDKNKFDKHSHLANMRKRKIEKARESAAKKQRNRLTSMIDKLQTSKGFVDRVELSMTPEDLVPMRRKPRMASLNAIAKVNAVLESFSPLAGKSIEQIKKSAHEKKVFAASLQHQQIKRRKPSSSSLTQTDDLDYPSLGEDEWIVSSATSAEGYRISPVALDQPISDNQVSSTSSWLPDDIILTGITTHDKAVQTVTNHKAVQTDSYLMDGVRNAHKRFQQQNTSRKESGCTCVRPDTKPIKNSLKSSDMVSGNALPSKIVSNKVVSNKLVSSHPVPSNSISKSKSPFTVIPVKPVPVRMVSNHDSQRYQIIHIPPTVATNMVTVPVRSSILTKTPTHTVAIPFTKSHILSHTDINKIKDRPTKQIINLHGNRTVLNLNNLAMSNAMIILGQPYSAFTKVLVQQPQQPPSQMTVLQQQHHRLQHKQSKGRGFTGSCRQKLSDSVDLKIPKINYQAASTSTFSSTTKQKVKAVHMKNLSSQLEKLLEGKKCAPRTPKMVNGWVFDGEPTEKPYAYDDQIAIRRYYPSMRRNNELINIRDAVLLKSGTKRKDLPFVARVAAIWEEDEGPNEGDMMLSLFWYYRPEQTDIGRLPEFHGEMEVLASRHRDDNSVACIVDKCYTLSYPQYCRYRARNRLLHESLETPLSPVPLTESTRPGSMPPPNTNPNMVYFCRQVYDFRSGRVLKNPLY